MSPLQLPTFDTTCAVLMYLDPLSGGMLVQMLLAAIAGVLVFFKSQCLRVLSVFGIGRKSDGAEDSDPS